MRRTYRILMLDDAPADAELIERELKTAGIPYEGRLVSTGDAFRRSLASFEPDLVLSDYTVPSFGGVQALELVRAASKDLPFVLVSGSIGEAGAIEIMRKGATDYVLKDNLARLGPAVVRALEEAEHKAGRRAAESALAQRAAELERSNVELEQFAYICSHDLREPLRMITTFIELIEERCAPVLDEESVSYMGTVVDGSLRMLRMVDGILEYSRARSSPYPITACDSALALQAALVDLGPTLKETGTLVTHGALPVVQANETQLARLFLNLIGNGIKFNREKPPRIDVGALREGMRWVFSVSDNGIGVSPEFREAVFKMFRRLHNRGQYAGEGIGLAVCRRIVERFGGRIWMDANPGGGSIVRFTLGA
jgi:signal transduction histidine kinase